MGKWDGDEDGDEEEEEEEGRRWEGKLGGNWEMVPLKGKKGEEERAEQTKAGVGSGWMLQLNMEGVRRWEGEIIEFKNHGLLEMEY